MRAWIVLANGAVLEGESFGAQGTKIGEVVFTTAMAGYEETLTDPSYYGQMITQTYPIIGNYGITGEDMESERIWAFGYIVREVCQTPSNFRCRHTLPEFLKQQGVMGISGVDTRRLTRILRVAGVMNGALTTEYSSAEQILADKALMQRICSYQVHNAVHSVSAAQRTQYGSSNAPYHVALFDFGYKHNIRRSLLARGCRVTVVPADTTAQQLRQEHFDGVMLSNGPGDPAENTQIIENLKEITAMRLPVFGICLGHQLTALAHGAKTEKMKYGHRGVNQPVTDLAKGRTFITSQNHGYAVVEDTLAPDVAQISHINANDHTVEGIRYRNIPCFTVQFHPEACGGPRDAAYLFDEFIAMMRAQKGES